TFLFRGFQHELGRGPGFRVDHLLMMSFDPGLVHYNEAQTQQFFHQLVERARAVPGVKSAAMTFGIPMGTDMVDSLSIVPEGFQFTKGKEETTVLADDVDGGYFDTQGIRILKGRAFLPTDTAGSPRVAVVNEEVAKNY